MLAVRKMHLEVELFKWLAMIVIALALATLFAVKTAGGGEVSPMPEPALMPPEMIETARALDQQPATPFFPEGNVPLAQTDPQLARELWNILKLQEAGNPADVHAAWQRLNLPVAAETWRPLGMAVAALQQNDLNQAERYLDAARQSDPGHPVVAYFFGILRLDQARHAEIPDRQFDTIRLAAFRPDQVAPATQGMHQLAAIVEFERAIENADRCNLADPLVRQAGLQGPTVGDLLKSWEADNYVGQAHNMLAYLTLEQGWLEMTEQHLDHAAATGIKTPFGYQDLGQAFEARQRPADAVRAYGKALEQHGLPWQSIVNTIQGVWEPWVE